MYKQYYGLQQEPFRLTPDPEFFFLGDKHNKSLANLLYGIENKKGFIALTGEVGAGKTTLCRLLLKQLKEDISVAVILNSLVDELTFLKQINRDFGIACDTDTHDSLVGDLYDFLISEKQKGKNVVVIVDECQNLKFEVLEQIRMLSNLETEKDKLLQIILIGQPEFIDMLNSHQLRQLNQRITVRAHISALAFDEMKSYIHHRLKVAGNEHAVDFSNSAFRKIYSFSGGIPRKINVISDYVLLAGYVENTRKITKQLVKRALKDIEIKRDPVPSSKPSAIKKRSIFKRYAIAALIIISLALFQKPILRLLDTQEQMHNNPLFANVLAAIHNIPGLQTQEANIKLRPEAIKTLPIIEVKSESASLKTKINKKSVRLKSKTKIADIVVKKNNKDTLPPLTEVKKENTVASKKEVTVIEPAKKLKKDVTIKKDQPVLKKETTIQTVMPETSKIAVRYFNSLKKEDKAVWLLLSNWGIELNHARIDDTGKPVPLIDQVSRFNFAIFSTWADLDLLIKINIPCAVEVIDNGKSVFYVLNAIKNDLVRLYTAPDKMKVIPIKEFLSIWQGNSYLLAEKSENTLEGGVAVYRGNEGDKVVKLMNILNKLKYPFEEISDVYDLKLEKIVKQFQKNNGLTSDGIVGVETKLLFYSKLSRNIPRLIMTLKKR